MARTYERTNLNYPGLISQAIQNSNESARLRAEGWRPGMTIGSGVRDIGNTLLQSGMSMYGNEESQKRAFEEAEKQRAFNEAFEKARAERNAEIQRQQTLMNQKFQEAENEKNRDNALELAKIQREAQMQYDMDNLIKERSSAQSSLEEAEELLRLTDNEDEQAMATAKARVEKAKALVKYYQDRINKITGNPTVESPSMEGKEETQDQEELLKQFTLTPTGSTESTGIKQEDYVKIAKDAIGATKFTNAETKIAIDAIGHITDKGVQQNLINELNRKKTVEEEKASRDKKLKEARAEYKKTGLFDSKLYKVTTDIDGNWDLDWR